jgi:hypothetical protein
MVHFQSHDLHFLKLLSFIQLRERLAIEDVKLLEELFMLEGIFFDPYSVEELETGYEDVTLRTISLLQHELEELVPNFEEVSDNFSLVYEIGAHKHHFNEF